MAGKKRIGELEQAAAYMQQQQGAQAGAKPSEEAPAGSNPDDVVDADFTKKGDNNA